MTATPLDEILTLDEAAAYLPVSERTLRGILREHPCYRKAGRRFIFTRSDIEDLLEHLRCHSPSSATSGDHPSTGSAAPSPEDTSTSLRELRTKFRQKRSASDARRKSSTRSSTANVRPF